MKAINTLLAGALLLTPGAFGQQQSPDQSSTSQNSQDVPHQKPGTNSPDVGKQRQPSQPDSKQPSQGENDVPHQKPETSNPDVNKQRQPAPKKTKKSKSTASGSTAT